MICPQCKAEYRRGFTVCADCGVPLAGSTDLARASTAEDEPAATPGDPSKDPFCSFWKGTDLRVCTEICTVLDEAEIPHKTIRRQDHLFNLNNQSPYEVGVPASLYEKAELAIKDAFGMDAEGAEAREIIEMSLKENDIRMRWEMQGGKPQLFVLPEDEERAKEIVREIVEGAPPE